MGGVAICCGGDLTVGEGLGKVSYLDFKSENPNCL